MSDTESPDNRRHFTRIPFDAGVTISNDSGHWQTQLLDISLNGILVSLPDDWHGKQGDDYSIQLALDADAVIVINSKVAHREDDQIGFSFENMELESASHLKRLLLFNLGEQSLVDREIHELISIHATGAPAPQTGV